MEELRPTRGLCLARRVETDSRVGLIWAPDDVVDKYTAQQFEIVAVGGPQLFEEVPDRLFDKPGWKSLQFGRKKYWLRDVTHQVGDWILVQPRVALPTGLRGLYAITHDNIMGRFHE